jgi:4-hydroxybenzoate polyprenyltransferase
MAFMIINAIVFMATFTFFAIQFKLTTFLYSLPFILVYLAMFMKKSLQDREGAEEPEKLLKNPYFAAYTIFLMVIFIISYFLK